LSVNPPPCSSTGIDAGFVEEEAETAVAVSAVGLFAAISRAKDAAELD